MIHLWKCPILYNVIASMDFIFNYGLSRSVSDMRITNPLFKGKNLGNWIDVSAIASTLVGIILI